MIRCMRSTIFTAYDRPPLTLVFRDSDLRDTLESVREGLKETASEALCVFDIFEMRDGASIEDVTVEATSRMQVRSQIESDMALQFHWNAAMLPRTSGVLANPRPAPLAAEDCAEVLLQLSQHPNYKSQVIVVVSRELRVVRMRDGEIVIEELES